MARFIRTQKKRIRIRAAPSCGTSMRKASSWKAVSGKRKKWEYARTDENGESIHTNTLEGLWSYPKNAIRGVPRDVSKRHLQKYLDEYIFRMSHRRDEANSGPPMFFTLLNQVSQHNATAA